MGTQIKSSLSVIAGASHSTTAILNSADDTISVVGNGGQRPSSGDTMGKFHWFKTGAPEIGAYDGNLARGAEMGLISGARTSAGLLSPPAGSQPQRPTMSRNHQHCAPSKGGVCRKPLLSKSLRNHSFENL